MATFFGEILPVTSRAVDDDDDEEYEVQNERSVIVEWTSAGSNVKPTCSALLIAVGPAATGFVENYIIDEKAEILGRVYSGFKDSSVQTHPQSKTDQLCVIYKSGGVLVCQCKTNISSELCFSWVDKLMTGIDLTQCEVMVLCSCMTSEYKTDIPVSALSPPFLRALKTTKYSKSLASKVLEQPNMITGLPAQVISYCQVQGLKAVVYVAYTESIFLDLPTIKTFLSLKTTLLKDLLKVSPPEDKVLLKMIAQQTSNNTLYM